MHPYDDAEFLISILVVWYLWAWIPSHLQEVLSWMFKMVSNILKELTLEVVSISIFFQCLDAASQLPWLHEAHEWSSTHTQEKKLDKMLQMLDFKLIKHHKIRIYMMLRKSAYKKKISKQNIS
jgi:hypothetical protein